MSPRPVAPDAIAATPPRSVDGARLRAHHARPGHVTAANISGDLGFRMAALMLWSLTFIPLGRTIAVSAPKAMCN